MNMNCEEIAQLIPDYVQHSLREPAAREVETHLAGCSECREEVELWNALAAVTVEQPSPMLRRTFDLMLDAYRQGRERTAQPKQRVALGWNWLRGFVPSAAAVALLAIGFVGGLYINRSRSDASELASLHRELTNTRQMVALSMLQQQSASDRLQGVSWSRRVDSDPQIIDALMHTLRYDASVDVRLAALDALRRYADQAPVRSRIEDSFSKQQSPLVQIALVDLMVDLKNPSAVEKLKAFEQIPDLHPTVRQRVEWGIHQLSRG